MKAKEIREMNKEEVKKILTDKRNRLLKLRFDISSRQIKNNREYRNIKKDIARILTIFKEAELKSSNLK
jgi:large subunit ribosomal protein L29